MNPITITVNIVSLLIGYFIGSVNPGYLFGKLKGIDIREEGTRNAGTANVYRTLGLVYAIPTALYDTLKGLLVIFITLTFGADPFFANLAGIAAILGHIFPFYLKFRGGQGVACATGMLLFYLVSYMVLNLNILFFLFYLMILVVIFTYVTKVGNLLAVIVLPPLAYFVFINYPGNLYNIFFTLILAQIVAIGLYNIIHRKLIVIKDENFKARWWRVATRPFAILFVIFYIFYSQGVALVIIGIVALVFIGLDVSRIIHKQTDELLTERIKLIFKKSESKKFSSMTIFLCAAFITMLLFEKNIAISALVFLIFGDIFSKIFGLAFGRHKIFDKSLEGTLAYVGSVLIIGYILFTLLNINLGILIVGGITAPLVELFSFQLNDNFTVSLISGTTMTVAKFFGL